MAAARKTFFDPAISLSLIHILTAGSIVIDEKTTINGSVWPQNVNGYTGPQTMRSALQQSINTCAVKIFLQVGADFSANQVKKFGITTLDTDCLLYTSRCV